MRAGRTHEPHSRKTLALLWTIQGALALLFLFAGSMKLTAPAAELARRSALPPLFLRFIGLAEVAGALGLVLPEILPVGRGLTALAAAGLVLIMVGATVLTAAAGQVGTAVFPAVVGLLAAFVVYKRRSPRGERAAPASATRAASAP